MAGQDEGDYGYSDDDLDALPDHAFDELQEHAVRSTQQPAAHARLPALRHQLRPEPVELAAECGQINAGGILGQRTDRRVLPPPSSDYGDFDDEMLDGEVLDGEVFDGGEQAALQTDHDADAAGMQAGDSTQREHWRHQRYGGLQPDIGASVLPAREQTTVNVPFTNGVIPRAQNSNVQTRKDILPKSLETSIQAPQQDVDVESLQAQVQKVGFTAYSPSSSLI